MKKKLFTILMLISFVSLLYGQNDTEMMKVQKTEAMEKLSFMIGTWEGTGYFQQGQSDRQSFDIHESIQPKLDGLVYLVEGVGTHDGTPVHNALALITWNVEKDEYAFESHTIDGRSVHASGALEDNSFVWGFDTPNGGQIRYTMDFSDGKWHETGSYTPDGNQWYPFMEMKLEKINE